MADDDKKAKQGEAKEDPAPSAEALESAVSARLAEAQKTWEEEKASILANREEIKGEKLKVAEAKAAAERRIAELELKLKAKDEGHDPDEFAAAVDQAAAEKFAALETEWRDGLKLKEDKLQEQEQRLTELAATSRRNACGWTLVEGMLGDRRIVHEGYMGDVIQKLEPHMAEAEVDGAKVLRFRTKSGTWIHSTSGKLMTPEEFFALQRAGKRVEGLPNIAVYLIDVAQGADIKEKTTGYSGKTYAAMTERERMDMIDSDPAAYQELVTRHAQELAAKTSSRATA